MSRGLRKLSKPRAQPEKKEMNPSSKHRLIALSSLLLLACAVAASIKAARKDTGYTLGELLDRMVDRQS